MYAYVHGALSPGGLSHGSRPLRRSEAWGRDNERRCGAGGIYIILRRVGLLSYWGLVKVQIIVQN